MDRSIAQVDARSKPSELEETAKAGQMLRSVLAWRRKHVRIQMLFALCFACTFVAAPMIGSVEIDLLNLFDFDAPFEDNSDAQIFFFARLPRVILASLAGATLAVAGLVFQAILQNPLATPYTLGIASGASLGAVVSIRLGLMVVIFGVSSLILSAFTGALLTVLVIYSMSHRRKRLPTSVMLLAGVSLNFLLSALILLVHYMANFTQSYQMLRWLMGGLDIIDYQLILNVLPFVVIGLVVTLSLSKKLNLISAGEELALSRGVDVERTKKVVYFIVSLMTASVVALSGPIGFVGLVVPHILRLLIGADNRQLIPAAIFFGATFLIICDTLARTIFAPMEVPVGIVTAMIGSPFFMWLLLMKRREAIFEF
ncbi:iron ABC transporter permease [bacterium]|nr:iron ABC transporter permease [bacterium]